MTFFSSLVIGRGAALVPDACDAMLMAFVSPDEALKPGLSPATRFARFTFSVTVAARPEGG
ncbi:hypothetical protein [Bosea sp. MMO-172]|uniref:hypothetical protein n=1 Tax=Bosea sp. MMO-172 TaxID=3127885 RepID=UPI003016465E